MALQRCSPMTREPLRPEFSRVHALRQLIQDWKQASHLHLIMPRAEFTHGYSYQTCQHRTRGSRGQQADCQQADCQQAQPSMDTCNMHVAARKICRPLTKAAHR